jgi:hypothetical protein
LWMNVAHNSSLNVCELILLLNIFLARNKGQLRIGI